LFVILLFMNSQNQIVLSLGSNQGNRLESIMSCIDIIHYEIATVVKVSRVYETPAWGFESDPFYNCAILIHTSKSAQKILSKILKLEKQLGRTRSNEIGYQARIIDIDIISCNEDVVAIENLEIPHKQMQNM